MASTTITVEGDKAYVTALGALAKRESITTAVLVRRALDAVYAEQLRPLEEPLNSFFANSNAHAHKSKREGAKTT